MSTAETLRQAIAEIPQGEPFVPGQFLTVSSRASIDQSLTRLTKAGEVLRVARGVYVRPKQSQYVGAVMPEPAAIAASIAKAQGAKIQIHGAEAARRLELTTQVPMQPVFYTSGRSRRINFGRMQIRLQHASPRRFVLAERSAGVALSALWHIGRRNVTPEIIERIRQQLTAEEFEALRTASTAMPAWLAEALNRESRLRA
jgi:hypothetical protein